MKYRVIIKAGWNNLMFDFETAMDALVFMDAATTKYQGTEEDEEKEKPMTFRVSMQMIKETPANE